jgi:plasmid stabilization system protein ParE
MSLGISISSRAEQDMTLQYRWYLENADEQTAEHYLLAVHETIQRMAGKPDLGRPRHFMAPELAHIRSIQVRRPIDRHLLFCWDGVTLRIERVIHGARGLLGRLLEQPGQP